MCTIAAAGLALTAITAAASYKSQSDAADAQSTVNAINAQNATDAAAIENNALEDRARQIEEESTDEMERLRISQLRALASARAAAADTGVQGLSVDRVVQSIGAEAGRGEQKIARRRDQLLRQVRMESHAVDARRQQRSMGIPVVNPSPTGLAIDLGAAGIEFERQRRNASGSKKD